MAFIMDVTSSSGIKITSAYVKITGYSCDKENNINARVNAYVSRELEMEGKSPIDETDTIIKIAGEYENDSVNTKKQIYEYMKTLPKYKNVIDVLE